MKIGWIPFLIRVKNVKYTKKCHVFYPDNLFLKSSKDFQKDDEMSAKC